MRRLETSVSSSCACSTNRPESHLDAPVDDWLPEPPVAGASAVELDPVAAGDRVRSWCSRVSLVSVDECRGPRSAARGGKAADRAPGAHGARRRARDRAGPALGRHADRQPGPHARAGGRRRARAHRGARRPARRPARPDARRGDEGRPDDLDGRLRRPCRRTSRTSYSASSPSCATTSRRSRSPTSRSSCAQEFGGPLQARLLRLRRARVRGSLDRPGPSRDDASTAMRWS